MMEVGVRIKKLRNEKDWSLRELENRTGINYSVLSRIESGKRPITDQEINIFSNIFEVSTDYLLGRTDKKESNAPYTAPLTEKDEQDIAKRMEEIKRDLTDKDGLNFYGEPMSEEAVESLLEAMEYAVRQTQRINKKYIPKKYRKDDNK